MTMDLSDVLHRIIVQHWRLVVAAVAVTVTLAALLHLNDSTTYTATARVVLDTQDPETRAESEAIADTAKAIATSPALVRRALAGAGLNDRDPLDVAREVNVGALGSSAVLQLSVTDKDGRVAAAVANGVAAELIEARLGVTQAHGRELMSNLASQIVDLNHTIAATDQQIDQLNLAYSQASSAAQARTLRGDIDDALRRRDFSVQQRGVLEAQRASLLSADALRPSPKVISEAAPPPDANRSRLWVDIPLGAMLGLVLGIGLAALLETLRPTVVGRELIARELGAPVLGTLSYPPSDERAVEESEDIAVRVRLAAASAGVGKVTLVPVGPEVDVVPLARRLGLNTGSYPVVVRAFAPSRESANGAGSGLVLVLPTNVRRADLIDAGHLLEVVHVRVIGLITYKDSRGARHAASEDQRPETTLAGQR
jgi:uncharacterized protein involved in exopolysaccharide biosynthesis